MTEIIGVTRWEPEQERKETMTEEIDPEIRREIHKKSRQKEMLAAVNEFRDAIRKFMEVANVDKNMLYLKHFGKISDALEEIEDRVHWNTEFKSDDDD